MKYVSLLALFTITGCALGEIDDALDKVEKVDKVINDIDIAECANACFDDKTAGNGFISMIECQDTCDSAGDACVTAEETCIDNKMPQCNGLETSNYYYCRDDVLDSCSLGCDEEEEDCFRECGNAATECFNGCLAELQASMKEIAN